MKVTLKDGKKVVVPEPNLAKALRTILGKKEADFCYVDHATGDVDHTNAHIKTEKCK